MRSKKQNYWIFVAIGVFILGILVLSSLSYNKLERFTNSKMSSDTKTLEYFYMPSCPHCKDFNPVWEELEEEVSRESIAVRLQKHNLMEDEELGKKYNVNAAPTILLVVSGHVKEYNGPRNKEAIISFIKDEL